MNGRLLSRIHRNDEGAALVLALILITVVALVVSVLLSYGDTSLRTTVALRNEAGTSYAADGAAEIAINQLRQGQFNNNPTSATYPKCFGAGATADTVTLSSFMPGTTGAANTSAAVTCSPDPATGAAGGLVPITDANKPGNAILTLGQNQNEDGINVKALNNSIPFTVHGSVVSDSNINVFSGSLDSNAAVYAATGCSGTIHTPAANCVPGSAADPDYKSDPYLDSANAVPPYRAVPARTAASCPGNVVTFQPGYYDDAAALSALMDGKGSNPCKGSVWWFKPGTYYFDFHNSGGQNPLLSGSDVWTVSDGQLVAGTPINGAGAVIAKPASPSTLPGACQNPITSTTAQGVQFIFGGDSQIVLSGSADAEICGTYNTGRPPIAFYGLKSGSASTSTANGLTLTSVPTTDGASFGATASVANLATADALAATWTKGNSSSQTGTFTAAGYAAAVPAGSILTGATLRVNYQNTANTNNDTRTVTFTPKDASGAVAAPIVLTLPTNTTTTMQTATFNLYSSGTGPLATMVHSLGYSGASAQYSSTVKHAGTENVDTIQLDLTYVAPAFRGETTASVSGNCLASTYTGGSAGQCAVLSTPTSYQGKFYIQGTTYVPAAVIDLVLSNITAQVLRFGVISRSLWIKETGAISYIGPVIEVPDNSPGFGPGGTVVYVNVYVCEAASSCSSTTGKLRLRVRVLIFDPSGTPSPPSRNITVQSWSVQR